MTSNDISLLLALIGSASLAAAWLGRKTGAARDTRLMAVLGAGKTALALGLWLVAEQV